MTHVLMLSGSFHKILKFRRTCHQSLIKQLVVLMTKGTLDLGIVCQTVRD